MDLIEHEYVSRMRINFPGGVREVWGQWHFCPDGAMPIPFLHPYLALEWHRGDLDYPGRLGEVRGSQRKAVLPDNPRYLGKCYIGTEADWCGETTYPPGFALEVDAEDVPTGCCADPLGTDGHYWNQRRREQSWSALVRHGVREFSTWDHARSWTVGVRTLARHKALWDHERSWSAVVRTSAHHEAFWEPERSWVGVYETTDHFAADWEPERSWEALVRTSAHHEAFWEPERSWSAVVRTSAHHEANWEPERSWAVVYETTDHFAEEWDREHQWGAVVKTLAHHEANWEPEQSWSTVVKTAAAYAESWNREHQWSAVVNTVDNVTNFSCGTVVAAGAAQGTATTIANDTVSATSTGIGQGVILPAGCYRVTIRNNNAAGGNSIFVYPPTGAKLGNNVVNTAITLAPQAAITCHEVTATQWVYFTAT